jgi:hypothetical protein
MPAFSARAATTQPGGERAAAPDQARRAQRARRRAPPARAPRRRRCPWSSRAARCGSRVGQRHPPHTRRGAQVPVEQWRAALWARALAEQGAADAPAGGAALQARFRAARLHHFRLEPGARVRGARWRPPPPGMSVGARLRAAPAWSLLRGCAARRRPPPSGMSLCLGRLGRACAACAQGAPRALPPPSAGHDCALAWCLVRTGAPGWCPGRACSLRWRPTRLWCACVWGSMKPWACVLPPF